MDSDPGSLYLYIILIVLFILGGGYFAACETAFASVSEIRLKLYADDGDKRAKIALNIKDKFDRALTTILIGNNIMHISCSSTATLLVTKLWGNGVVAIATFITTFIVFMFAEIIPKAYAKDCNEKVALAYASSLDFLMTLFTPFNFFFTKISTIVTSLFGVRSEDDVTVSEEELFDIIENIDKEDKILEDEAELVKSALDFTIKTAKDILIPIDKVVKIDDTLKQEEIDSLIINGEYTRLPVFEKDEVLGVLQIRKYLKNKLNNKKKLITKAALDKPVYIKATKPIDELLDYMSLHKAHMAFVRDDNLKLLGILTVEDILEELVGEIYDEEEKERVKL